MVKKDELMELNRRMHLKSLVYKLPEVHRDYKNRLIAQQLKVARLNVRSLMTEFLTIASVSQFPEVLHLLYRRHAISISCFVRFQVYRYL
ncbi:hypothetical protein D3C80_1587990 [compost metagenome]